MLNHRRKGALGAKGGGKKAVTSSTKPQAPPPSAPSQLPPEMAVALDKVKIELMEEVDAKVNELLEKKMAALDGTDAYLKTLEAKVERVSFRENVLQITLESRMDDVGNRIEGLEAIDLEKLCLRVDDIDTRLGDIHDTATFALVSLVLVDHPVDAGFFIPSFVFPLSLSFSLISPTLQTNFDQTVNATKSTAEEAKATAMDANSTAEQLTLNLENRIRRFETEIEQKHSAHEESMSKLIAAKMASTKKEFKKVRDFISNSAKPSFEYLEEQMLQLGTRVTAVEKDLMVFKGSSA